jgi:tetratricopeptide (TPR) repeat protein
VTARQEPAANASRLLLLLDFLESDPENLNLIGDAADAALDESALDRVGELVARYRALAEVPPPLLNIEGIAAMRQGRLDEAAATFTALRASGHDHSSLRFNLAWVSALQQRHDDVLALLDDEVVGAVPRAAALKVQTLHHLDRIEDAIAAGQGMAELYPNDNHLLGALSVAAMDADDFELAKHYAMRADGGADALTTQGLISLNDDAPEAAAALFDRALAEHPDAPRAWLGRGLSLLAQGDADGAAPCIDKGAEIFGDHLGSWIASGWTHFVRKDLGAARHSFETALSHDDNFAETHGALAVLDIAEGSIDSARKRTDIALRLDKECFGGILARTLLLEFDGKPELAAKIRDRAMNMPMSVDGKTLAQAMIGLGMNGGAGKASGKDGA